MLAITAAQVRTAALSHVNDSNMNSVMVALDRFGDDLGVNKPHILDYISNKDVFQYADGYVSIPQGPGLGIEVNEAYVIERAKDGHRWRNPIWRHEDGSFAEW